MRFTHSIAFKLALLVLGLTSAILGAVILYSYLYSMDIILAHSENDAQLLAFSVSRRIEQEFRAAAKVSEDLARFLEAEPLMESWRLLKLLQTTVADNQEVYGSAVAYEPYGFAADQRLFAPYFFKREDSLQYVQLGSESYDYLKRDWYHVPAQARAAVWTEPYFDEGGGNVLMVSYSVPFFELSEEGWRNKLRGVVTADISLEWLTQLVVSTKVGRGGHC
ncbi:MAG: PDC sensor domain-containing protein, partial [Deltaproteobacteria bacterium]|nr:PDC sensor domain-containing protein [Deltaproteobacteria bacterium]